MAESPVEQAVVGESATIEQTAQNSPQMRVVRLIVEAKRADAIEVGAELACTEERTEKQQNEKIKERKKRRITRE